MRESEAPLVRRLATLKGIQTSYVDMAGTTREAPLESLKAILEIHGLDVSNSHELRNALDCELSARAATFIEPVTIAWDGELSGIPPDLPSQWQRKGVKLTLRLEDGAKRAGNYTELCRELRRVGRLPLGYHQLQIEVKNRIFQTLVIASPRRSYYRSESESPRQRERQRSRQGSARTDGEPIDSTRAGFLDFPAGKWGAFMPLYALQSRRSWGAGNLGDLKSLAERIANSGGRVLSTLPLLAEFLDGSAFDPSPYSPISRLFWNEFYVDIERLPEFLDCKAAQKEFWSSSFRKRLKSARRSEWVDYEEQMRLRRDVLELLATHCLGPRHAFDEFLRKRPLLKDYARFRAVYDRLGSPWQKWPQRLRQGKIAAGDFAESDARYHLYAQCTVQRQIEEFGESCRDRNIRLYLDLPVGVSRDGFDVWRNQELFAVNASAGAPPDMFFSNGQNWGFPPMIPERLRSSRYQHVIAYLRFQMRHASMLRIDHVMGLHRLYWIPPGFSAEQGAYVRYPAQELHAIVCLESHRNRCEIIGENLGTVAEEVNRAMEEHGHGKMYVVQFGQRASEKALRSPPKRAVASLNTHDTATFAAHWRGLDIPFRVKLGLLKKSQAKQEIMRRKELNRCTTKFLKRKGLLKNERAGAPTVLKALLRWLGKSSAETVLIWLEDLWGETRPQNVPGTLAEYPNWRRKAALSLEQIELAPMPLRTSVQ